MLRQKSTKLQQPTKSNGALRYSQRSTDGGMRNRGNVELNFLPHAVITELFGATSWLRIQSLASLQVLDIPPEVYLHEHECRFTRCGRPRRG